MDGKHVALDDKTQLYLMLMAYNVEIREIEDLPSYAKTYYAEAVVTYQSSMCTPPVWNISFKAKN
jgi:hypothetical protein